MLSQKILAIIDKRLRQATGRKDTYFGGLSIILVGDPGQLLPVADTPLYESHPSTTLKIHGFQCYKQFNHAIRLEVCVRQQADSNPDQAKFIYLLPRLRNGVNDENTVNDWQLLLKNSTTPLRMEAFKDALHLFPDNRSCNLYNLHKLKQIDMPIAKLLAINNPSRARNFDSETFSGIENIVVLSVGAKVVLVTNIWTRMGLLNGANGIIRDIIFDKNNVNNSLPIAVLVEFEFYIGPRLFSDVNRFDWIPIAPYEAYNPLQSIRRTNIPLRLAYALTIHKAQGQTLSKVVIDLGNLERTLGLTYVAFSRIRHFNDFLVKPFSLERLQKLSLSKSLQPRLNEEARLNKIIETTYDEYQHLI